MRSFLGFGQVPFIGTPGARGVKLAGIATVVVPLLFQWISYGADTTKPNINVNCDLNGKACTALDVIKSIYVDNLGNDVPVYVYFPDTQSTVVAKPNSEGWYPVFTNEKRFFVIGEGFFTGDIGQTLIVAANVYIPPSVNNEIDTAVALWKASPQITRGTSIYSNNLGTPALGDQFFSSGLLNFAGVGATQNMWNTPQPSGFIYVTMLNVYCADCFMVAGAKLGQIVLESTGVAGILIVPNFYGPQGTILSTGVTPPPLLLPGLQLKLDATQTWRLRVAVSVDNGFVQAFSSYTYQPS